MSFELWLAFVATVAILIVIPGPTTLTVLGYSLSYGRRAAFTLVAAVVLGDSTALALSLFGLGSVLATSAFWFAAVKFVGGLYLLFLGVQALRRGIGNAPAAPPPLAGSRWQLFANTWLVTALNPKGIIFYVAFLPQFVIPDAPVAPQLWLLAATFIALALINATLYTVFAASLSDLLSSAHARRRFDLAGGALLSAAGIWALFARRAS